MLAQGSSANSCLYHIQQSPPCFDSQQKKNRHYTLNTLHYTLYTTLTIHSKHAICHKSLNSQNLPSLSLSVSLPASLTQLPKFLINQTCFLRILLSQKPVFTVSSCTRHKANVTAIFPKKHGGHYLA